MTRLPQDPAEITGLVLAGGLARRMQDGRSDVDKGLVRFRGEAMVEHVLRRLAPQVDRLLINANRNQAEYRRYGHAVVADEIAGYAGPLAGLHAGLQTATTEWVVTVPCDSPFFPQDLVARLLQAAQAQNATWRWRGPARSRIRSSRWYAGRCCRTWRHSSPRASARSTAGMRRCARSKSAFPTRLPSATSIRARS